MPRLSSRLFFYLDLPINGRAGIVRFRPAAAGGLILLGAALGTASPAVPVKAPVVVVTGLSPVVVPAGLVAFAALRADARS